MFLIALVIKLESRGPVFYFSKRMGRNKQIFRMIKFRTMFLNSDRLLEKYSHLNIYGENEEEIFWKLKKDPRVTAFGRVLRRLNLDELPQLINILLGHMSVVGNRPLPIYEAKRIIRAGYEDRFKCPAGLTGLWQIQKDRHDIASEQRISLDIDYAENHSLSRDLKIILKTLFN